MLRNKFIAVGLCAAVFMGQAMPVMADETAETLAAQIQDLETKKADLLGQIDDLSLQLVTSMAEIEDLETQIDDKGEEIEATTSDLNDAEAIRQTEYNAMKKRIQYLYENGGDGSWLETLLDSDDLTKILDQVEYTEKLYKYDRDCLAEYAQTVENVNDLKTQQEAEKSSLENLKTAEETNQTKLNGLLEEAKTQYTDYDGQLADAVAMASQYQAILVQQEALYQQMTTAQQAAIAAGDEETAKEYTAQIVAMSTASTSTGSSSSSSSSSGSSSSGSSSSGSSSSTYSSTSSSSLGSAIASLGLTYLGGTYVYGGTDLSTGVDCSGFVNQLYAAYGISVPRTSGELASSGSSVSSLSDAEAGDVICYDGHVGIYLGDGTIVHASNEENGIMISDVNASGDIVAIQRYS